VTGANPSRFQGTNNPVDSVSWNDAMAFCKKLTEIERKKSKLPDNYAYTLPTQAQWVTLTDSASLDTAVSSLSGMRNSTASVGSLGPNQLGLYDTRGNVWEFCLDRHDPSQAYRVLRGGAWDTTVKINMRIDFRFYATGPNDAKDDFGFRCVLIKTRSSASNQSGGPIVLH
ncbi:MAG TPA: SUMF1/EgtB/PvdO family nonheme iron enzyme, partial [Verrucomicrobiae bacterium]|nr:SUMF1/EgtB/PvdO family nonheme iron enzyme [Verrucomicrobiae bacterium]